MSPLRLPAKRHKYRAKPLTIDGIRFASTKEANRYCELKLLEKIGDIWGLELQPRYRLCAWSNRPGEKPALGHYVADFRYHVSPHCVCAWGCVVEDVKGVRTALYRWKRKHVEAQYGIRITEV